MGNVTADDNSSEVSIVTKSWRKVKGFEMEFGNLFFDWAI